MDLRTISRRVAACAARIPTTKRTPKLCIVMAGDPDGDRKCHEAEAAGDPVLHVTLFDSDGTEQGENAHV
jgi:hypothetical protein